MQFRQVNYRENNTNSLNNLETLPQSFITNFEPLIFIEKHKMKASSKRKYLCMMKKRNDYWQFLPEHLFSFLQERRELEISHKYP